MKRAEYLLLGVILGLSMQETLSLPVGQLLDLWEVYVRTKFPKSE